MDTGSIKINKILPISKKLIRLFKRYFSEHGNYIFVILFVQKHLCAI